jgi:hypothetical protein
VIAKEESVTKRPAVDTKVYALAEWFIWDIPGATEDDISELAGVIQTPCEGAAREIEERWAKENPAATARKKT